LATGEELTRFQGHDAFGRSLVFSPDGKTLATGLSDSTVLIWDLGAALHRVGQALKPARPADLDQHWAALAGADAHEAWKSMWALTAAPKDALATIARHLQPVAPADPARMHRLIADLDHDDFAIRESATRDLARLDLLAEPALRAALEGDVPQERRRRAEKLLEQLRGPVTTPETRQAVRVVAVLEHIGRPEARQLLQRLAAGAPQARLTQEAKASLERLSRRYSRKPEGQVGVVASVPTPSPSDRPAVSLGEWQPAVETAGSEGATAEVRNPTQ
jgi:hypothetical protein